jgi:hypothetical protein
MQYESENPLSVVTLGLTNTVKDFTKKMWLLKSGTKASEPEVWWQNLMEIEERCT